MFEILEKDLKASLRELSKIESSISPCILAILKEFAQFKSSDNPPPENLGLLIKTLKDADFLETIQVQKII